jgi:MSHA pilin protein MshC
MRPEWPLWPLGSQCARRHRARGYTMIELIVVLTLMGTLAAVAIPRLTDRTAMQERGFQDDVKSMLRHSRKVAVSQQRGVCVLLTPAQASAVYDNGPGCNAAAPVATPGNTDPFVVRVPTGVVLGGAALVRFNTTGQPVPNIDHLINVGALAFTVSRETGIIY